MHAFVQFNVMWTIIVWSLIAWIFKFCTYGMNKTFNCSNNIKAVYFIINETVAFTRKKIAYVIPWIWFLFETQIDFDFI